MVGNRLIRGSRLVRGGRLVRILVNGGIRGLALILDIHHIAGVAISGVVGDNLGAAVGEEDTVGAIGRVAITGLLSTELNVAIVGVLGINSILVLVLGRRILVLGLMVGRGGFVGWGRLVGVRGSSHGDEGKEGDEGLQFVMWEVS